MRNRLTFANVIGVLLENKKKMYMETPYFLPTEPVLFAMRTAAYIKNMRDIYATRKFDEKKGMEKEKLATARRLLPMGINTFGSFMIPMTSRLITSTKRPNFVYRNLRRKPPIMPYGQTSALNYGSFSISVSCSPICTEVPTGRN